MIHIRSFPRVHVGLIDMGGATQRRHGGAGFMLNRPCIEVVVKNGSLNNSCLSNLDTCAQDDVRSILKKLQNDRRFRPGTLSVVKLPPQHTGLGTKTALILAILKAFAIHSKQEISETDLQHLSGRGGVSGIGIHGFFRGGFIVDGGHLQKPETSYGPSSVQKAFTIPPLTFQSPIPTNWVFILCSTLGKCFSGKTKKEFFKRTCPISTFAVFRTMASVYHGVVPSVLAGDLNKLKASIERINTCGFKKHELLNQTTEVRSMYRSLNKIAGCAVGMSSMGPTLFAMCQASDIKLLENVQATVENSGGHIIEITRGQNGGFEIL